MSTYSGFSSRKLEDKYNHYLKELLTLLSQIVISQIESSKIVPFKSSYYKLQTELKKLDAQKYSQPKFSKVLQSLTEHFQQLDCVKQWHSQPEKKKSRPLVNNNFVKARNQSFDGRTRNGSLDEARRTISFSTSSNQKSQNQKQMFFKQNRYNFQQGVNQKQKEKIVQKFSEHVRSKKIYRSRQVSAHLVGAADLKYNFDQNEPLANPPELSMEELMKKNPLVERKMSAQKKRRLIKFDFPQIREQEEEDGEQIQEDDQSTSSKLINQESFLKTHLPQRSVKSYFKYQPLQQFSELQDRTDSKGFIRT